MDRTARATPSPESAAPDRRLARIDLVTPLSVVVPTYREAANLPELIDRVAQLRQRQGIELELLIMDDDSRDGTAEAVAAAGHDWVRLIVRDANHGLSPAVIDGFRAARYPVLVCMDADLSHPVERIPDLVLALDAGQQLVIGSRYVPGGSTDHDWGLLRYLNSRVATWLARPLTSVRDPMAGFFAMRKADFDRAAELNPVGYKIALELIVKCGLDNVGEVPIHFANRVHGESKLTLHEQLKYLQHLRRLYGFKFRNALELSRFLGIGATGVVVNLAVLTGLAVAGARDWLALAGGVGVSALSNAVLKYLATRRTGERVASRVHVAGVVGISALGAVVNYAVALLVHRLWLEPAPLGLQTAALCGIAAGLVFNFAGNRFSVFRRRFVSVRPKSKTD